MVEKPVFIEPEIYVYRQRKFLPPLKMPQGKIEIQQSPSRTGKTIRANAWMAEDPENRRVVDGDHEEAYSLICQGYDVMLNFNTPSEE